MPRIARAAPLLLAVALASACGSAGPTGGQRPTAGTGLRNPAASFGPAATFGAQPTLGAPLGGLPSLTAPSFAPPIGGSVTGSNQHVLRLRPQTFSDPASGNVPALTVLVPDGWQAQAGVQWLPEWERVAHLATTVTDPATGITVDWLPLQDFIWFDAGGFNAPVGGNYQGKAYVPPITDPLQFVQQFWMPNVLSNLQSARFTGGTEVPAVAQEFLRGFGGPGDAHAYRLRYAYQQNGQSWEEDVNLALLVSQGQGVTSWYVNFAYATRAPQGVLDANAGVISAVVASRTTTPQWEANYRLVQRLFTQGIQQQMADTQAFGQLLAQYRAESQQLQAEVTAERQASQDRIADLRGQSLLGVDTYVSPIDGTYVQLPQRWAEYWVNPAGEYLTTDTPGFDPNQTDNRGWQRLTLRP